MRGEERSMAMIQFSVLTVVGEPKASDREEISADYLSFSVDVGFVLSAMLTRRSIKEYQAGRALLMIAHLPVRLEQCNRAVMVIISQSHG